MRPWFRRADGLPVACPPVGHVLEVEMQLSAKSRSMQRSAPVTCYSPPEKQKEVQGLEQKCTFTLVEPGACKKWLHTLKFDEIWIVYWWEDANVQTRPMHRMTCFMSSKVLLHTNLVSAKLQAGRWPICALQEGLQQTRHQKHTHTHIA